MKAMIATQDQFTLAGAILRKRREMIDQAIREKRELVIPSGIDATYQRTKGVLVRWNEDISNGQPLYYDLKDYEAMSQLAIWLVQKHCEIVGTEVPPITAIWSVCFEAQGVGSLKEAGLAL